MPPDLGDLPEEERQVVARALEKRPEDRWPNCRAFVLALAEAVHTEGGRLAPQGGSTLVAGARARILKLLTRWRFVNPSGSTLVAGDQTTPMTKCVTQLPETQRGSPPVPVSTPVPVPVSTPVPTQVTAPTLPGSPVPGPGATVVAVGIELVPIPAGEFLMGSPDDDPDADDVEKPRHRVRIVRPFRLGAFAV